MTQAEYSAPSAISLSKAIFDYDLLGNRNTVYDTLNGVTYSYEPNLAAEYTKLSTGLSPTDYYYDVRGNLSRDDGFDDESSDDFFEYSYDPENRLTEVGYDDDATPPLTVVAKYRYDAQGRRVEFVNSPPDGVTRTLRYDYDGPNP